MKNLYAAFLSLCTLMACQNKNSPKHDLQNEIRNTENAFVNRAKTNGIAEAFIYYADNNAVLNRGSLIKGKQAIIAYFDKNKTHYAQSTLSWEPDFIEISQSGDLAYTYGSYQFTYKNKQNITQTDTGIFHTVWKKQTDGTWKYVWD